MAKKPTKKPVSKKRAAAKPAARKRATPVAPTRLRQHTKQARLIDLLRRPEGATLAQACAALDWKPHSVRGALAGTLKKRLHLNVRSEKPEGGDRVYRIAG